MTPKTVLWFSQRIVVAALVVVLVSSCVVVWMGATVCNDTYDAFDYMAGAKALAQSHPDWYPSFRPFGPSVLGAVWAVFYQGPENSMRLFRVLHIQSAVLSLAFLVVGAALFDRLGKTGVVVPLALLAMCRLFPRYGWAFLSDLPAALFVALGFLVIIRRKPEPHDWLWSGLFFGVAATFKFYLVGAGVFAALAWALTRTGKPCLRGAAGLVGTAIGSAGAIHMSVSAVLTGGSLPKREFWMEVLSSQIRNGAKLGVSNSEPWWEYGPMVLAMIGIPAVLFAVVGLVGVASHRDRSAKVVLVWLFGMGAMLMVAGHKEARYLFPVLIPIVWIVAVGVTRVGEILSSSHPEAQDGDCVVPELETSSFSISSRKARNCAEVYSCTPHKEIRSLTTKLRKSAVSGRELSRPERDRKGLVAAVALSAGLFPFAQEIVGLSDPMLRQPVQKEMAEAIAFHADRQQGVVLVGPFYPLVLERELFSHRDEFYSVFHLGASQIIFFEEIPARLVIGSPTEADYWLPLGQIPNGDKAAPIVASPYRELIQGSLTELVIENPMSLALIHGSTTAFQRVVDLQSGSPTYRSDQGETIPRAGGEVRFTSAGILEEWFALESGGQAVAIGVSGPGPSALRLDSDLEPAGLVRVRYQRIAEISPRGFR